MNIAHLGLVALAVFCIWETAKPLLPHNLPDLVPALLLSGTAYALLRWAPDELVNVLAIVATVGVLHQKVGVTTTGSYALRLPGRRDTSGIAPLP